MRLQLKTGDTDEKERAAADMLDWRRQKSLSDNYFPLLAGGDKGEGETERSKDIRHVFHPHPNPPPSEAVSQCHFEAAAEKS
jgi:hypothetical protein